MCRISCDVSQSVATEKNFGAPVWARNLFSVSYIAYEEKNLADISQIFNFCNVTNSEASVLRSPKQAFHHLYC